MLSNLIIEGIDRIGKDTLVTGVLDKLGFMQVVHYQKPLALQFLNGSFEAYQRASFYKMFLMLDQGQMLLNRAHLGEVVYAPRYRKYDGSYVFELEASHPIALNNTMLVLLHTSSWVPITDDGESFDFSKKDEEQASFKEAWESSAITHKLMIDVAYQDAFVPASLITQTVYEYMLKYRASWAQQSISFVSTVDANTKQKEWTLIAEMI